MEKEIICSVKLKEINNTAKRFYKDDYEKAVGPCKHIVQEVMKSNDIKAIPALLKISKTEMYQDNGMAQMMFMSATYDILTTS